MIDVTGVPVTVALAGPLSEANPHPLKCGLSAVSLGIRANLFELIAVE